MVKVLVVDDQPIVRAALTTVLASDPEISVVGEAGDGEEAVAKALALTPDIVIMDVMMPKMDGIQATAAIKQQLPGTRVLMLTVSERDGDLFGALRVGAQGYLIKSASVAEIKDMVHRVARGESSVSPAMAVKLVDEFKRKSEEPQLSPRETEILKLVAQGLKNSEIAGKLFIDEVTVKTHIHRMLEKLHLRNRVEAANYLRSHYL